MALSLALPPGATQRCTGQEAPPKDHILDKRGGIAYPSRKESQIPRPRYVGTRPRNVLDMSKRSLWSHFTQKNRWDDMTVTANAGPICLDYEELPFVAIWKIAGIGLDWWGRLPFHMLCLNIMVRPNTAEFLASGPKVAYVPTLS
ncbi:uncharacterized protein LOC127749823 [Frankliniella occidentalis]|uniref:Uncharacterized protein LOC127749823 n=1 Tax=Frankliniella occidentalis TaxID=133901 RepID=A0A9C6U124_FRAOC|nr:uncharacterized protein LOC127749823 [Frankliniella occidentalis]